MFESWAQQGALSKGTNMLAKGIYYRVAKQQGSLQFRYWISTQRLDYEKFLGFYNIVN